MPKLMILSSEFPPGPGGIGTHAHQLAVHLEKLGWEIRILAAQDYAPQKEIQQFNSGQNFKIANLSSSGNFISKIFVRRKILRSQLLEWKPDLLLASGDRMIYLAGFLLIGRKLPWIAVEHGRIPGHFERILKRWVLGRATAVICVSEYTRAQVLNMGVKSKGTKVIPNGADESRFQILPQEEIKIFKKKWGLKESRILLTVGHVSERKGQDIVIRALPDILKKISNVHYCMIGLPTERERFEKIARELNIEKQVHFMGAADPETLVAALNACDLFVMTSRHSNDGSFEGYGIAVVEAALCGKPSVVSNDSGLREAIREDETGIGVPENDPGKTAQAILKILEYETLKIRMGEEARRRALTEQTWNRRAVEYDMLLRTFLK